MEETGHIQDIGKSSGRIRVLWLANIPSPYRVDFFNELGKYCALTVLFERRASSERDESWKDYRMDYFQGIFLYGKTLGTAEAFCPGIIRHITRQYEYIIVTNYSDPTGLLAIAFMKARKIPYLIEGDGAFPKSGKDMREKLKHWSISGAEACFSTGRMHDAYYRVYDAKKIIRYPFSSVRAVDICKYLMSSIEKAQLRASLGIPEKQMVLAVGQLIPRKGYDVLVRAAEKMDCSVGFYIIGDQPRDSSPTESDSMVRMNEYAHSEHLHFISFKKREELKQYYRAADLFVHPCREDIWGLVVNEALSCGLPVISTEKCNAALELVKDGINGCILPVEDSDALADAIHAYLLRLDTAEYKDLTWAALGSVKDYTIEKMAERHMEVFSNGPV